MKRILVCVLLFLSLSRNHTEAAPATLLFQDEFNAGIPGWSPVQPPGTYLDGPMRWYYDIVSGNFSENSNVYTDNANFSPSGTAVFLVNDTVVTQPYAFKARLTAGDDDGFGLVFGYQDPTNVYRVTFSRQNRGTNGYPWFGWTVDRKVDNVMVPLFGGGTPGYVPNFTNIANRPFDVTIAVTNQNLTLTVVDDPAGLTNGPIEIKLIENQPLPTAANGKVGLLQWGQSGGTPRSFRIENLSLQPTPLSGNPNGATAWTNVTTLRADGTNTIPPGRYYLPVLVSGAAGVLSEDLDNANGNDAPGQIDFPVSALVAGNESWSNIVFKVRSQPTDDDGHGLLLRYQNRTNFYRIAFRNQSSTIGVKRGLSIQKSVNGVFSEVFSETNPQFLFPANVPFEITAVINTNRLEILIRGYLNNATPTNYFYGPIDITEPFVPNGKVGLWSWAMSRSDFDYARVYQIEGALLEIGSTYDVSSPPVGLHGYTPGTSITASVPQLLAVSPGIRRRSTGFSGIGAAPTSGTTNSVTFTINSITSLSWNWVTEYEVIANASAGGTVAASGQGWLPANSNITVTATANSGFVFAGWSGSSASLVSNLNLTVTQPYTLTASFKADSDNDGLPDDWETLHFSNLTTTTGAGDADGDGVSDRDEFQRGSNPKFSETTVLTNAFSGRWENLQRDPVLPGVLVVRDFGGGFRGVWENSNDNRNAVNTPFLGAFTNAFVSFEGPRMIIRTNAWNPAWTNFVASTTFSVGDNDGTCVYFRYQNESNWYRVTLLYEVSTGNIDRPRTGISLQKRFNGVFTELGTAAFFADPSDGTNPDTINNPAGYKRFKIRVTANGGQIEVGVTGWNVFSEPPSFDPNSERFINVDDPDLLSGRYGIGAWGQQGTIPFGGASATNPVDAGVLMEDVTVEVNGTNVFTETWDTVPLLDQLPVGWRDPWGTGTWNQSAHSSVIQLSNFSPPTTTTSGVPKADADSANLIGPAVAVGQYLLEIGFHPFDSDGIGFIYDFVDTNNYSRVLFVNAATADGRVPRGLNVSRKSSGVWSDIIVGDPAFVYVPGQPFTAQLAKNSQGYRLTARNIDDGATATWAWTGSGGGANPAFGLASWGEVDGHYEYLRVLSLGVAAQADLTITRAQIVTGNLVLTIESGGAAYDVQSSPTMAANSWTTIASNQTQTTFSTPYSSATPKLFYRLVKNQAGAQ